MKTLVTILAAVTILMSNIALADGTNKLNDAKAETSIETSFNYYDETEMAVVTLEGMANTTVYVNLYRRSGELISKKKITEKNVAHVRHNLKDLSEGTYKVKVFTDTEILLTKAITK